MTWDFRGQQKDMKQSELFSLDLADAIMFAWGLPVHVFHMLEPFLSHGFGKTELVCCEDDIMKVLDFAWVTQDACDKDSMPTK